MVTFVETGKDPYKEDPEELAEWVDGWRPDDFDLNEFKQRFDR